MLRFITTVVLTAIVIGTGCTPERPTTIAVRGKVTFDGSPPPAEGMLMFAPIEAAEGYPKRGGQAKFDTSGEFRATTFADGDGLIPGKYRVNVECWKTPPQMNDPSAGESYVSPRYERMVVEIKTDDSPRELDIEVMQAK